MNDMVAARGRDLDARLAPSLRRLERRLRGAPLVVAVSGGGDSRALLDLLAHAAREIRLHVAHVNHGWRGNDSDQDELFVRDVARRLDLPFHPVRLDRMSTGGGREARARHERYRALAEIARRCGTHHIALAHQQDDQVETVLMRIARGAGLRGLRGMAESSVRCVPGPSGPQPLVLHRPLLALPRADLVAYSQERALDFREDLSNRNLEMLRNRMRLEIIPRLRREAFPDLDQRVVELAGLARRLVERAREGVRACACETPVLWHGAALDAARLARLAPALLVPGILEAMAPEFGACLPRRAGLLGLRRWLDAAARQRRPSRLTLRAGLEVVRLGPWCLIGRPIREHELERPRVLTLPGGLEMPAWRRRLTARPIAGVDVPAALRAARCDRWRAVVARHPLCPPFLVRRRRAGDRVHLLGSPGHRRLKKVLSDHKMPGFQRDNLPIVTAGGEIIWIPGIGIARHVRLEVRQADPREEAGHRPPRPESHGLPEAVELRFDAGD